MSRRFLFRMALLGLVAGAAVAVLGTMLEGNIVSAVIVGAMSASCGLAALLLMIGLNFLLLPRRAGRLFDQQKSLHRETTFTWDDNGTEWISDNGHTRYPWPEYHQWTKTRNVILLFMNDNFMHFIPRRVLGIAADDLIATIGTAGVRPR